MPDSKYRCQIQIDGKIDARLAFYAPENAYMSIFRRPGRKITYNIIGNYKHQSNFSNTVYYIDFALKYVSCNLKKQKQASQFHFKCKLPIRHKNGFFRGVECEILFQLLSSTIGHTRKCVQKPQILLNST